MHYFILDKNLKTVAIASTDNSSAKSFNVLEDKYTEFSNAPSALEISFDFYNEKSLEVKEGAYITFEFEGKNKLLQIKQVEEIHGSESSVVAYAEESSYELLDSVVFPHTYNNQSLKYLLEICLMDTDWIVGETSNINVSSFEFDSYGTALSQVQKLAEETGCILNFHIDFSPQKGVTGKYVDLVEKVNVDEGKRLEFGVNIDSVKRIVDRTEICTAVIPIGENETLVTGFDWVNKYDDKTIEKEKSSYFLHVNEEKRMEINPNSDLHLFYALNVDSTDKSTLCQKGYEYLKNHKEPKYTYEVNAIILKDESYVIGEQVRIIDDELGVSMIAEVEERTVSQTNPDTNEIVLTNYIEKKSNISQEFYNMQSKLQTSVLNNPLITVDPDEPLIKEVNGEGTIWIDTSNQLSTGIIILKQYDAEKGEWLTEQEMPSNDKVAEDIATESAGIKSIVSTWVEQRELSILKGTTLPTTAIDGQLFINTNTNIMYRWNGTEWIQLTPSITSVSELQAKADELQDLVSNLQTKADETLNKINATIVKQPTAPTDTTVIWYDTNVNEMKMYINGEWKIVTQTSSEIEDIVDSKTNTKFDEVTGNITVINQTLEQHAGQISSKVEQTTYNTDLENLNATIESQGTQITQNTEAIGLKANQISVDDLTNRVSDAEAELIVQAGEIDLKANQTTVDNLTSRVSNTESELNVQAGQISLKANQTDLNTLSGRVSNAEAELIVQSGQISSKVEQSTFDNLTIGARNCILKSDFSNITNSGVWTFANGIATGYSAQLKASEHSFIIYTSPYFQNNCKGKTCTFSMEYKIEEELTYGTTNPWVGMQFNYQKSDGNRTYISWIGEKDIGTNITNGWIKKSITFTIPIDVQSVPTIFNIYFRDTTGKILFKNPMLEIGSKASDYQKAPEDIEESITTIDGKVESNSSSITQLSTQIESKVSKDTYESDKTTMTERIESAESTITQTANSIDSVVTEKVTSEVQAQAGTIKDEILGQVNSDYTEFQTRLSTAESNISQNADKIALKVNTSDYNTDKAGIISRISSAESSITQNANNIALKVSTSTYNADMSTLNSTVNNHTSLINQNATSISQRVTKEEFEGLKIGGSNFFKQSGRWTTLPTWWKSNGGGMTLDTSVKYCGYNTLKTTVGSGIVGNNGSYFEIDSNKTYTYSAMIKSSGDYVGTNATPLHYHCSSDGSSNVAGVTVIKYDQQLVADEWKLCYLTFKPKGAYFRPYIYIGSSQSLTLNIAYLQLEEGDKPTGWMMNADDINDMDISLGNRLTTVESKVTDSAIVDTVTTSTTYTNAINNLQSQITQNNNSVKVNFQNASGINLLRNSTGYDGLKYWTPTSSGSTQIIGIADPTAEVFGLNNAFYFNQYTNQKRIYQDVPCKPRTKYTVSFYVNKLQETKIDSSKSDQLIISARNSSDTYITGTTIKDNTYTKGYQYFTFTVTTGDIYTLRISLYGDCETNAYIAGLMLVEGDIAREWTPHVEEAYSDEITMNSEGIRVSRLDNGNKVGYTVMSHDEFAGYYDTDSNGTYEKIFYLDGDATMSKRVAVTSDIVMGDLKATMYNSTNNKGWAFIPATASDKRLTEGSDESSE